MRWGFALWAAFKKEKKNDKVESLSLDLNGLDLHEGSYTANVFD